MASSAEEIFEEFVVKGWKSNPFEKLLLLLQEQREQALPLALLIIERAPKGGGFFDLLLSHLAEEEFRQVVNVALERMADGPSEVLDSVIAYSALQLPALLRPHLGALFDLRPNSGSYYEAWPWRSADPQEIARLKEVVTSSASESLRKRAWSCLLNTGQLDCIEYAARTFAPEFDSGCGFEAYAHLAGFDIGKNPPRRLHTELAHHITFPADYFAEAGRPPWLARLIHPTWTLDVPPVADAGFGGVSRSRCGCCGGQLHRLIQFGSADKILGIRMPQIEFSTCLSCLGWEQPELFFSHDDFGVPSPFALDLPLRVPQFPAVPLKDAVVLIKCSPSRWQLQDWVLSNSCENLNRIGGSPSWIQDSQYPRCPKCSELMMFIMQLDSDLPTMDGSEWLWGSGGIAYFFWCDDCAISASLWQCT
jgi:hypothetical protein